MKIYQLHGYSGEWEDFHDYIIGSYLRKERAEEKQAEAEAREAELIKQSDKCSHCPFIYSIGFSLDDLLIEHSDYCADAKLEEFEDDIYCDNRYCHWNDSTFEIKEVEVEE